MSSKVRTSSGTRSMRSNSSAIRTVTILGRRGPHQIAMTPKELGELGHLEEASPVVDAADFPPVEADDALGARSSQVDHYPARVRGDAGGRQQAEAHGLRLLRQAARDRGRRQGASGSSSSVPSWTRMGAARGTGETYEVPASLVITAIGYSTPPIDGVPYDERGGKFRNEGGVVGDRLYAVGWARRGPTGTIGTNRPDGYEVAEQVVGAMPPGSSIRPAGRRGAEAPAGRARRHADRL